MKGFLRIGDTAFELNDSALYSKALFYLDDEDIDHYIMAINALFKLGLYGDEEVYPEISIYVGKTDFNDVSSMVGMVIEMNDTHISRKKGDVADILGCEAFDKYKTKILEIENGEMHIEVSGQIIKDIDDWPRETEEFYMDVWLTIEYL